MKAEIEQVYLEIHSKLNRTPLLRNQSLEALAGCQLFFKMENQQITGSFKLRGVLSKFLELHTREGNPDRVVAASTGNHALAVCHVAKTCGVTSVIFVPENVSRSKLAMLQNLGVEIIQQGRQCDETEQLAINYAQKNEIPLIHPYNDTAVIVGQGTIGLELAEQLETIDQGFVPGGGGGLISGSAALLKETLPRVKVIGVQPKNACEMSESVVQGRVVAPLNLDTISDGTAGGLDTKTITLDFCRDLVDEFVLVEEQEIITSLKLIEVYLGIMIEPAAALALAGILNNAAQVADSSCVAIISGGNIDTQQYLNLFL
jgi:threonine dehydratase